MQLDPEFRTQVEAVMDTYRQSVSAREDLSAAEKDRLLRDMGLDEEEQLLFDPKRYRKALKAYTTKMRVELKGRLACSGIDESVR